MSKLMGVAVVMLGLAVGCATAPKTQEKRDVLVSDAEATLQQMTARDPGLSNLLTQSAGYVVFPNIGKGGAIVGGAYGRGVVYQNGQHVGFAELNQASLGAQLGGQSFSELLVFEDPYTLERLKNGRFELGAQASAVALNAGAAAATGFGDDGVTVFVMPRGGLMVDVSVSGQQINYQPRG